MLDWGILSLDFVYDLTLASVCVHQVTALQTSADRPTIAPGDLHVIVDNMLQGLGRQLRCCGVDCVILENTDCHDRAGEVSGAVESCLGDLSAWRGPVIHVFGVDSYPFLQ